MARKRESEIRQPFSLNTVLLSKRLVERWGTRRKEKFFKDLGLGHIWKRKLKTSMSGPYHLSEMFDYIHTKQREILPDVIREIIRVELYLLSWDQQFAPSQSKIKNMTLPDIFFERHPQLADSLRADGFEMHEQDIIPISLEELKEVKNDLESKLKRERFDTALVHYDQAWENYVLSNWEATNAQLRSFLQEVFDELALRLYPKKAVSKQVGGDRRSLLESEGFIESEKGAYIRGLFTMLNTRGSHPGTSNEADCRLRQAVVAQLANHYLDKAIMM